MRDYHLSIYILFSMYIFIIRDNIFWNNGRDSSEKIKKISDSGYNLWIQIYLDYKHVTYMFYVRNNIAGDRYILLKPAARNMVTKIQDTIIYYFIFNYLCVFNFTFKNISILWFLRWDINLLVKLISVSVNRMCSNYQ